MNDIRILHGDCLEEMASMDPYSVHCVITSPPYNLGIKYGKYKDDLPRDSYLKWIDDVAQEVKRMLTSDGHFFLNIGYTNQDPWVAMDVAQVVRSHFVLQNNITWIKHIKIDKDTFGIYKPIHSPRYATPTNESIFHFTKTGKVKVDRTSISGEYNPRKGKYASSYTEEASKKRHEADLRRRTAKKLGYTRWQDVLDQDDFQVEYQKMLMDKPFCFLPPKDEGNSWYIPYTPIAKLAKQMGATEKGTNNTGKGSHPATFPIDLPERCIRFSGIPKGSVVLDPFVGTGTTLLACKKLDMQGIGIDLDERYIEHTKQRLDLFEQEMTK